jgi:predicted methyltransferase
MENKGSKVMCQRFTRIVLLLSSLVFALPSSAAELQATGLNWTQVLDGEHRSNGNRGRDEFRHPMQTLMFFGVQSCDTVVELWPGGGWYTEVLAPILKDCGKFYAAHFAADSSVQYFRQSRSNFGLKLAANPEVYAAVEITTLSPPESLALAPAGTVDKVLTFRNVHNWLKSDTAPQVFAAAYTALKPGGILGVVEHRADPNSDLQTMIESGYVSEQTVIALAERAGFLLLANSEVNANLKDDHHHPKGVWSLPPSLRLGETDKAKYLAIGESDRMTLKFGKPVHE